MKEISLYVLNSQKYIEFWTSQILMYSDEKDLADYIIRIDKKTPLTHKILMTLSKSDLLKYNLKKLILAEFDIKVLMNRLTTSAVISSTSTGDYIYDALRQINFIKSVPYKKVLKMSKENLKYQLLLNRETDMNERTNRCNIGYIRDLEATIEENFNEMDKLADQVYFLDKITIKL